MMWLEETLNQFKLQCPRKMMDLEAQQHLKDDLFHGVHSTFMTSSICTVPLVPPTCSWWLPPERWSKHEETWERVRARAMVTTYLGKGMADLGQQITKLMAALTQTGQGSSHSSVPPSSLESMDEDRKGGAPLVTWTPTVVALVLTRQPQPKICPHRMG